MADICDRTIPGPDGDIPVRVYTPRGSGPFPNLVYFHGGGWVLGNLEVVHGPCTVLANRAHAVVVSVDYRLAPEHKFPAAVDDSYAATTWVADNGWLINGDVERIAVAGDSAGGNLAAVVALLARDKGYPSLMPAADLPDDRRQLRHGVVPGERGRLLPHHRPDEVVPPALPRPHEDAGDWRVSPLRAADLTGLPPAHVITAEFDPLRDEGEAHAARLREAGVDATVERSGGQIHAFAANLAGVMDDGRKSIEDAGRKLRQVFRAGWQPRLWL